VIDGGFEDDDDNLPILRRLGGIKSSLKGNPSAAATYHREMSQEFNDHAPSAGDGAWLKPSELPASPFGHRSDYAVHIGSFPDGTPLTYSGDGSLITIAPPGSGKTQCHVIPNLLTWTGPAVVLDLSGDIYE
jgi:type IV secretion system protein VirD4